MLKSLLMAMLLGLAGRPAVAAPPALDSSVVGGYQEAVRSQMQELIRSAMADFFSHSGRSVPEAIEVKSHADFDLAQAEPRLIQLVLDVSMTSDQPAAVLREARQQIMRTLRGNGYRFEAATTAAEARMPQVRLNLDVRTVERVEQGNGPREYAVFGALAGGCVAFLVLSMAVLLRPWRRRRARRQRGDAADDGSGLPPLPVISVAAQGHPSRLPPMDSVRQPPNSPRVDPDLA